ncbi:MAG: hypothetical protein IIX48_06345 [Lachnospiraceae bacterium]|nr:hypothetical protein [Lachnospiraceae bacterium]
MMSIEQICILFCILQILVMVIVMLACANRAKKWKFNPNEYRFVPDKNKKWNLNVMLQGMTDQGVLWIVAALYLFIIILMEIVFIVGVPEYLRDAGYPWIVIGFPFLSIGTLVGVSLLIIRGSQKKDYVKTLIYNSLPYANCKSDELEAVLENEIKDGVLIHTKRVNFSQNYIFISRSRMVFSPIAIALNSIAQIRYAGHNRGGIYIVQAELKDGRRVEMSFNNLASYKFIAMINYYNIPIKW